MTAPCSTMSVPVEAVPMNAPVLAAAMLVEAKGQRFIAGDSRRRGMRRLSTTVKPLMLLIVVPLGMPKPLTASPTVSPVVLASVSVVRLVRFAVPVKVHRSSCRLSSGKRPPVWRHCCGKMRLRRWC